MAPLGSRVRLPLDISSPFEVFINGVEQEQGRDYTVENGQLVFTQKLIPPRKDNARSLFRTLFYGRYSPEHVVDVAYQANGRHRVESGLEILS
jgi:hypothetical protein